MIEFQNIGLRWSKKRWPIRTAHFKKNCSANNLKGSADFVHLVIDPQKGKG